MKLFLFIFAFLIFAPSAPADTIATLSAASTVTIGSVIQPHNTVFVNQLFQAAGAVSTSTGTATVKYQGSNDKVNWVDIGSVSLTLGVAITSGTVVSTQNWKYTRGNLTALTGTSPSITALVNY